MWRAVVSLVCAVLVMALPAPALAQPTNGQLAVVLRDQIVAVNPDGTGLRPLYTPPSGDLIMGPAWSPDGNKLAFSYQGKINVLDLTTRSVTSLTTPGPGARDVEPTWSVAGDVIGFRRMGAVNQRLKIDLNGVPLSQVSLDLVPFALALAPDLERHAYTAGPLLFLSSLGEFWLRDSATGPLALSHDGSALAYVDTGLGAYDPGLTIIPDVWGTPKNTRVTPLAAASPRWAPDAGALAFLYDGSVLTVPALKDGTATVVPRTAGATAVDWQPCVEGKTTVGCRSVSAPTCSAAPAQVTTVTDQPVKLPAPPCTDPAGLPLHVEPVSGGDHGSVSDWVYTPRPGFVGQDLVTYRVSNGSAVSDLVRVPVFVVPRPVAGGPAPSPNRPSATVAAPFLSARVKPTLDRKRATLVRLACDQACSFTVRLEGTLRGKKKQPFKGKALKRALEPGRVLALRLKLPTKPKGRLKTVFITGTVRGETGASRPVKLAVAVRR